MTANVFIFDTAAGRLVGSVDPTIPAGPFTNAVALKEPAVLEIQRTDQDEGLAVNYGNIAYAADVYYLAEGGVRGFTRATGVFLDEYHKHLAERSAGAVSTTEVTASR